MINFFERNKTVFAVIIAGLLISSAVNSLNVSVLKSDLFENQSSKIKDSAVQPAPASQEESKPIESYIDQIDLSFNNEAKDSVAESALNDQKESNISEALTPLKSMEPQADLYKVVKIIDGDTVAVDISGKIETIRLIGINTPETVDPRKPVECFGKEASNKAKEILTGKSVRLEADNTQGELDKYNRLLRYVFLEDGINFNKTMISEGYAYEYAYNFPYKYQSEFKQAGKEAKEAQKGLWAPDACNAQISTTTIASIPVISSTIASSLTPALAQYNCSGNIYNCSDFSTHAEAQAAFEACGGAANDIHRLDSDKDGSSCESLP